VHLRVFIQARMGSNRYPGKVLAPFRGRPLVDHVVEAASAVVGPDSVVVATSTSPSDDPLVAHLEARGVAVFRGEHEDVLSRFVACARVFPADWIVRLSADSPLVSHNVIDAVVSRVADGVDVVTTIHPQRTFPRGQNAEAVRTETLIGLLSEDLEQPDREHVTRFIYRHPDRFAIVSIDAGTGIDVPQHDTAIDTVEDLQRLEGLE
jgi:spore coat polysaccharide biosynthesis protein SpsF